jgi:murein DD-endopeptidase MepM/ murein hydrolase activator NlpD
VVHLSHGNGRVTVYGHLSRIDVRKGQKVQQGQRVGAVGATGWATGPHLHFEFRINGVHQDPLKVARASETITLDATARPRFADMAQIAQGKLEVANSLAGGRSNFE